MDLAESDEDREIVKALLIENHIIDFVGVVKVIFWSVSVNN